MVAIQLLFLEECTSNWPPLVVGVYHGNHKPSIVNEYLEDFVTKALLMQQMGYRYRNQVLKIDIFGFSCDAPANGAMKYKKIHTGYESCPKCEVHGKWAGHVVFLETKAPLITHTSFINQSQDRYHKDRSVLERLDIDKVKAFANDYMHCVYLEAMRKLLWTWIKGPLATRICRQSIELISSALAGLLAFLPDE